MPRPLRLSLAAAAVALCALLLGAAGALAATLTISPGGQVHAASTEPIHFLTELTTISCEVTLTLSLQAGPIRKEVGNRVGEVTGVSWSECSGGEMGAALNLPWPVLYSSIAGTLPTDVTSLQLEFTGLRIRFNTLGGFANCLYAGGGIPVLSLLPVGTRMEGEYHVSAIQFSASLLRSSGLGCPMGNNMAGTMVLDSEPVFTFTS